MPSGSSDADQHGKPATGTTDAAAAQKRPAEEPGVLKEHLAGHPAARTAKKVSKLAGLQNVAPKAANTRKRTRGDTS